jgi:hypothetical protein
MRRILFENDERGIDDALDQMIREMAPQIARAVKEQEVDEDVNEFYEGAIDAVDDLESYMDYRFPHEEKYEDAPTNSDLYKQGYAYGKANFDRISAGMQDIVDVDTRRQQIAKAIEEFNGTLTEETIIAGLEEAIAYGKEQMGDVHHLIKQATKKYGWKAYAAIAAVEILEHFVIPYVAASVFPPAAVLATIPTVEILAAMGIAVHKYKNPKAPEPHKPGHLDWAEEQGMVVDHRTRTLRLTEAKLRRTIRKAILQSRV